MAGRCPGATDLSKVSMQVQDRTGAWYHARLVVWAICCSHTQADDSIHELVTSFLSGSDEMAYSAVLHGGQNESESSKVYMFQLLVDLPLCPSLILKNMTDRYRVPACQNGPQR